MKNLLYTLAVMLLISWAIGFLAFNAGALIHLLPLAALAAVLLRLYQGKEPI